MSLASQVSAAFTAVGEHIRDNIVPRLIPTGGATDQVLAKSGSGNFLLKWVTLFSGSYNDLNDKPTLGTAAALNIHVGTTAPGSPTTGQIWIDTN